MMIAIYFFFLLLINIVISTFIVIFLFSPNLSRPGTPITPALPVIIMSSCFQGRPTGTPLTVFLRSKLRFGAEIECETLFRKYLLFRNLQTSILSPKTWSSLPEQSTSTCCQACITVYGYSIIPGIPLFFQIR